MSEFETYYCLIFFFFLQDIKLHIPGKGTNNTDYLYFLFTEFLQKGIISVHQKNNGTM